MKTRWLLTSGLLLGGCGVESKSILSGADEDFIAQQTVVPDYFGKKGYVVTSEYRASFEGRDVVKTLKDLEVSFVASLESAAKTDKPTEIPVPGWRGDRWARDAGPLSAVSRSSEALKFMRFGSSSAVTKALSSWFQRDTVVVDAQTDSSNFIINGYADCFLIRPKSQDSHFEADLREKAGCKRVTFLEALPGASSTRHLHQWLRFVTDEHVLVARLVDLTGREDADIASNLRKYRQFWDDQARAMVEQGYQVTRLPVFLESKGSSRPAFFSTLGGILIEKVYLAPDFPSLKAAFEERYEVEKEAVERELKGLGFDVKWLSGEESARKGGSFHRAVLSVHESS